MAVRIPRGADGALPPRRWVLAGLAAGLHPDPARTTEVVGHLVLDGGRIGLSLSTPEGVSWVRHGRRGDLAVRGEVGRTDVILGDLALAVLVVARHEPGAGPSRAAHLELSAALGASPMGAGVVCAQAVTPRRSMRSRWLSPMSIDWSRR